MTDPSFLRSRDRSAEAAPSAYPPLPEPLPVPLYDNHTHLEIHDGIEPLTWSEHLDRAAQVGVLGVVQVGTDLDTSRWSVELAERDPRVLAAVALHPNEAPALAERGELDGHLDAIEALASHPRVRAIGETGLDFFRSEGPAAHAAQVRSFERHIEIAHRHDRALQIHDRDAHGAVVDVLRGVGAPERTVFHCFSGDADFARLVTDAGWFVSFSGTVTFRNAHAIREALAAVPLDRILIETDAPYLTPTPYRGRPNAPYLLPHTLAAMAEVRGIDRVELAIQLASNTHTVYGEWSP